MKSRRQGWVFNCLIQILDCAAGGICGGKNWYGAVMWEELDCFCHLLRASFWDIHGVASVVL